MSNFTDLEVWKKARNIRLEVFKLTKIFPQEEKYRLADQIIRSSRSIGNNIAEGHGRFHYADAAKFLVNARGSASETIDHLIIANDDGYIDEKTLSDLQKQCSDCMRMINGYIAYLKKQANEDKN